jgi:hypothetical protein
VEPIPDILRRLRAVLQAGGRLVMLLNYTVFEDPEYIEKLGLPAQDKAYVVSHTLPAFAAYGLTISHYEFLDCAPSHRTTWGQRLVKGSGRRTLRREATAA